MKRKLKVGKSVKGTPPITKFFKKHPDIKAKQLTAVVKICDISPTKVSGKVPHPENNTKTKTVQGIESEIKANNTSEIVDKNALNKKNVNKLLHNKQDVKKGCKDKLENSSRKDTIQKRAKKSLFDHLDSNHSPELNVSSVLEDKSRAIHKRDKANSSSLNSEKETEDHCDSLENSIVGSKLRPSEYKSDMSAKHFQSEKKLSDESDHVGSMCDNSEQCLSMEPEDSIRRVRRDASLSREKLNNVTYRKTRRKKTPSLTEEPETMATEENKENVSESDCFTTGNEEHACPEQYVTNTKNMDCRQLSETIIIEDDTEDEIDSDKDSSTDEELFNPVAFLSDNRLKPGVRTPEKATTPITGSLFTPISPYIPQTKDVGVPLKYSLDQLLLEKPKQVQKDKTLARLKLAMEQAIETEDDTEDEIDSDKDSSTDEELFNPVAFLSDNRLKPGVRTPEKATTPITGSLFTPISPYIPQTKDVGVPLKYSLDQLLLEKPKQVQKDKTLARLKLAMEQAIETGRNLSKADDSTQKNQDEEKSLLPHHQKELGKYNSTEKGFAEETPGENLFPSLRKPIKHKNGCSQPFPVVESVDMDEFATFLYERSDVEIRELLCCDWITHKYLLQPCPSPVLQWLFHVLCFHLDNHTVKASYNALWSLLYVGDGKENLKELSWIPSVQNVIKVFEIYGINLTSVLSNVCESCESMDIMENLMNITCERRDCTDNDGEEVWSIFPLVNFTRLIQFMTLCLDRYPTSYSSRDIEHLVVLLYCVSLDEHMEICQHDIKTCLHAAYAAVESSDWIETLMKMSSIIHRIQTSHRNILRVVQLQPYSGRGRDMKRLAALQTLASFSQNNTSIDVNSFLQADPDVSKDKEITNTIEMFTKLDTLLHEVNVNDDTDYCQLYTMIELMNVVVGSERLQPQEKAVVGKITKKLKSLHSDIKDPRAMFISRSKVKDLVLRTITKFAYMIQGKKDSQKTITKLFGKGKSDLQIETLEESEIMEEEDENELQASCFIVEPLPLTNEHHSDLQIETLEESEIMEEEGENELQASCFIVEPLPLTNEHHSDNESLPESQEFLTQC